jgi:membrane fusion protein (multidrug efflux system)
VVLDQDRATEAAARGRLQEARTQVAVTQANVGEAKAEFDAALTNAQNMQEDYQRFTRLDPRARSQQQMDNSSAAQRSTAATVEQARAKVEAAQAQVVDSQASIVTAQANLAKAEADTLEAQIQLSYCKIIAPENGTITHKSVEAGQYLEIGQPLFSIVPTDVWVTANYKETQLDLMHPGEAVTISVDAYPEHEFRGHVQSIQNGTGSKFTLLPPENATGNFVKVVQRVPVKIVFEPGQTNDPNHPLGLGMSVIARVKVRS